jgi:ELWxxDGT repeat protein
VHLAVAQNVPAPALPAARLVADINPSGSATPQPLAAVGRTFFFIATDGVSGLELWRSDGTNAGTVLVKDIREGPAGQTGTISAVAFGTVLLFGAEDGLHGRELWTSDGTEAGTQMVVDLTPSGSSAVSNLTVSGGRVFFTASTPTGTELWSTDGTAAGTVLVKDILTGSGSSTPGQLRDAAGVLYFAATSTSGREPWVSDGTAEGTQQLFDIAPGSASSNPGGFTLLRGHVYFTATNAALGIELWSTDGTETGTMLVKDILSGSSSSNPASLTALGDDLLFVAQDSLVGRELWVSDGTPSGTFSLTNLAGSGVPVTPIAALGRQAVFYAQQSAEGAELWRSDGTPGGTYLLKDINPGSGSSASGASVTFAVAGKRVFFAAADGETGPELWSSDGTADGTFLVSDIRAGAAGSGPASIVVAAGRLYFSADDGTTGRELWTLDLAPIIAFSGNRASYRVDETVAIACSVVETFPLVEVSCPNVTSPAYEFALGENTIAAAAADEAGNRTEAHVTFEVTVDFESLATLVTRFSATPGVALALNAKLAAAADAEQRGNAHAKAGVLGAFAHQVAAQSGKALSADQAAVLLRLVEAL